MKQQLTIHLDEELVALVDAKIKRTGDASRSSFINEVMLKYFRKNFNNDDPGDVDMMKVSNDIASLVEMNHILYRNVCYLNSLINGGLPIFDTNTSTKVIRPTPNLKKEASRKMMLNYAKLLKGEMSREDYFLSEESEDE